MLPLNQFKRFDVRDLIRAASSRFPKFASAWTLSNRTKV